MKTRLITAAVGVPFLIFTLVVRGWFAEFVIVALTFIAMYETCLLYTSPSPRDCS